MQMLGFKDIKDVMRFFDVCFYILKFYNMVVIEVFQVEECECCCFCDVIFLDEIRIIFGKILNVIKYYNLLCIKIV